MTELHDGLEWTVSPGTRTKVILDAFRIIGLGANVADVPEAEQVPRLAKHIRAAAEMFRGTNDSNLGVALCELAQQCLQGPT